MIAPFTLHQPRVLEEACALLSLYGDDAKLLAGGSELILLLKLGLISPQQVIDLKTIVEFDQIAFDDKQQVLRLGALVTHRALARSEAAHQHFPLIVEMERQVANVRVRNVGTVAGNLCFAEPHADPGTLLLAYGARVTTRSSGRQRRLPMSDFFADYYETKLENDEILVEIEIPKLAGNFTGAYLRFCPGERPMVAVALLMGWNHRGAEDVRLVLGCVGPTPIRVVEVEKQLMCRSSRDMVAVAMDAGYRAALLCDPIEDVWGSKEYKRQVVKTLVARAIYEASEKHDDRGRF
jgi:aerobic carbon-monoxide dehydrogenase medium subunit